MTIKQTPIDPVTLETNVPGLHMAGSIVSGRAISEVFIENGRFDGEKIFGDAASITEQTDAWVRFDVTGTDLSRVFERLSNVDLASAPDHVATRTVIDHIGCYLVKRSPSRISLFGPRSSAPSLWHALETAARAAF
mgnify:CR=1 FL=1